VRLPWSGVGHACSAMTATNLHSCGGHVNPYPSIYAHTWPWPGGRLLPGQWAASFILTRLHAIVQVIACSFICNRDLACGDRANLDYCDVTTITGDYDMAIINRTAFTMCCLVGPLLLTMCPCCTGDMRLAWVITSLGVSLWRLGPRLLVGIRCKNTYHVESPDFSPG
jgi:hypothetical protein